MNLSKLTLRDFRNYSYLELEPAPGVNLIVGDNAQGKTNLLEAISYLGSGKSFRAQKTAEMVRFSADFADVEGEIQSQGRNQTPPGDGWGIRRCAHCAPIMKRH